MVYNMKIIGQYEKLSKYKLCKDWEVSLMVKGRRFLSAMLTALVLSISLCAGNVQAAAVTRTDGGDGGRIGTANKVATDLFGKASNVILVNGYGYADAVSATPLAKQL